MRHIFSLSFFLSISLISALCLGGPGGEQFPTHPDQQLTPGELCHTPTEIRYPEKIKYCERNVSNETKAEVIRKYDQALSYDIERMPRQDFKIDHLIPLCMGGSNSRTNLWPQNKAIYTQTDPFEEELCTQMARGQLLQKDAVKRILQIKLRY